MAKIGLVLRPGMPEIKKLGRELLDWANSNGHQVLLGLDAAKVLKMSGGCSPQELAAHTDLIVSLGGDGTLIGVARYVSEKSPLMVGVNFGTLGFLTEISPNELFHTLTEHFNGTGLAGERSLLRAEVYRGPKVIFASQAVNDVVLQKGVREKLVELDIAVNDEAVMRLRGDGIIVSTPTGSTAYSLAAGGSIVYPLLSVILITPICPHSLNVRPLILPLEKLITLRIPPYDGKVFLIIDGQDSMQLAAGDEIRVCCSPNKVRFARSPKRSYFEILRGKLNWGLGNSSNLQ